MSRDFSKNVNNFMTLGTAGLANLINGAAQVSAAVWVYFDTLTAAANANRAFTILVDGVNTGMMVGVHNGTSAVIRAGARSQAADAFQTRDGTTVVSTGAWHLLGAVFNIGGDVITPYLDGVAEGSGAVTFGATTWTKGAPTQADAVGGVIGGLGVPPSTDSQVDGRIAHFGLWNTGLSAQNFADMFGGANMGAIETANLVSYLRLAGYDSPEPNLVTGAPSGTIANIVPAGAENPSVWIPTRLPTDAIIPSLGF